MKQHLNTLFVTTQGAYLHKKGDAVVVRVEKKDCLRIPLINLGGIVCFGRVSASPFLLGNCAQHGVSFSFLTNNGRFLAAVNGFTKGNVILRREQYRRADDSASSTQIARSCIIGKLANYRTVIRRASRESKLSESTTLLDQTATRMGVSLTELDKVDNVDSVRGIEGEASASYFRIFDHLITNQKDDFQFSTRSRRPPLDPVNALLSFLYSILMHDVRSACEAVGLDPAVGFLHRDRPGRPSLALDLMEELRPVFADRVVLSLINRQQLKANQFIRQETGGVIMQDEAKKTVLATYQKRKLETIMHPYLQEKVTLGLIPHLQARLLARYLRGDLDAYPPFVWK